MAQYIIQLESISNVKDLCFSDFLDELADELIFSETFDCDSSLEHIEDLNEQNSIEAKKVFFNHLRTFGVIADEETNIITFTEESCLKIFKDRFSKLRDYFGNEDNSTSFSFSSGIDTLLELVSDENDWLINSASLGFFIVPLDDFIRSRFQSTYGALSYKDSPLESTFSLVYVKALSYM